MFAKLPACHATPRIGPEGVVQAPRELRREHNTAMATPSVIERHESASTATRGREYCMTESDLARDVLLRCSGLSKIYADGQVAALSDIDLSIRRGEFVAIMGPSGSGKSTLLQILGLLDTPTSGEFSFENQPTSRMRATDRVRAEKIGFVFQSFHLLPMLTALENVQVPMFEGRLGPRERIAKAAKLLEQAGIGHRAHHLPHTMSVGERQRVAIARSLANDPLLLLADEPTGARYQDRRGDPRPVRRLAQPLGDNGGAGHARSTRRPTGRAVDSHP